MLSRSPIAHGKSVLLFNRVNATEPQTVFGICIGHHKLLFGVELQNRGFPGFEFKRQLLVNRSPADPVFCSQLRRKLLNGHRSLLDTLVDCPPSIADSSSDRLVRFASEHWLVSRCFRLRLAGRFAGGSFCGLLFR